jgi:hypothetical protein
LSTTLDLPLFARCCHVFSTARLFINALQQTAENQERHSSQIIAF